MKFSPWWLTHVSLQQPRPTFILFYRTFQLLENRAHVGQPKLQSGLHGVRLMPPPFRDAGHGIDSCPFHGACPAPGSSPQPSWAHGHSLFHKRSSVSYLNQKHPCQLINFARESIKVITTVSPLLAEGGGVAQERVYGRISGARVPLPTGHGICGAEPGLPG